MSILFVTYSGYMSPEYIMGGIFSIKSDVFSFGVIVLEVLSGKKNRMTYMDKPHTQLLGYVSLAYLHIMLTFILLRLISAILFAA